MPHQADYGGKLSIVTYIIVTSYTPSYSRARNLFVYCLGRIFVISLGVLFTMIASVLIFPRCDIPQSTPDPNTHFIL